MELRDILRAEKSDIAVGEWKERKIRRADFPMSSKKGGVFPLTRAYRWQILGFGAKGKEFSILVAYSTRVPSYMAVLAETTGTDSRIICRLEYNAGHVGWHVHASCAELAQITTGIVKPRDQQRIPAAGVPHRKDKYTLDKFAMDDKLATAIALRKYRIPRTIDMISEARIP